MSLFSRDHPYLTFKCWAACCEGAMCGLAHKAALCIQLIWFRKGCGSAHSLSALLWKDPVRIQIGSEIIPNQLPSLLFTTWPPVSCTPGSQGGLQPKSLFRIWEQLCRGLIFVMLQNLWSCLLCQLHQYEPSFLFFHRCFRLKSTAAPYNSRQHSPMLFHYHRSAPLGIWLDVLWRDITSCSVRCRSS